MSDMATMLLVEHDEGVIALFRATLELARRYRLFVASDAASGLRMAHDDHPDIVVISHMGTGLNGLALCQQIKSHPELADVVVVLLVDAGAVDVRLAGITYGVGEYLARPPHPAEILNKLNAMSRLRRAQLLVRQEREELDALHDQLRSRFTQLLALLGAMLDMEYALFRDLYQIMYGDLPQPQLIVYLHLGIERVRERIKQRGRSYEQRIGAEYLMQLQDRYLDHLQKRPGSQVLVVDIEQHDLMQDSDAYDRLISLIVEEGHAPHRVATL